MPSPTPPSNPPTPTPSVPEHFDYRPAAAAATLTPDDLRAIQRVFEADYPHDLMLRELHILRACNANRDGFAKLADIIKASTADGKEGLAA